MLNVRCEEHLAAVRKAADEKGLRKQLEEQLETLRSFGGDPDRVEVTLTKDFAPLSFGWSMRKLVNGEWRHWFCGGLIYQGPTSPADGGLPSLCVSLASGEGWFIHT